jgi:hypothetical protein
MQRLAITQDEFTLVCNPQPLTGIQEVTWSSVSEQKHHHPRHRRKCSSDTLNHFSTGFRRRYWALIASVSTLLFFGRYFHNHLPSTVYSPRIRYVRCFSFRSSSNTYVLTSLVSVHDQSVRVLFLGLPIPQWFKPFLRAILKTWSRYTSLIVSFIIHIFHIYLLLTAWQPIICIGLGTGVLADALIAFSMCWSLHHKRTGFSRHEFIFLRLYRRFG